MTKLHALMGGAMSLIGAIKMWFHMGSVPLLSLPTCNGEVLTISLGQSAWYERAHCWGCYLFAAGLAILVAYGVQRMQQRYALSAKMD